MRGAFDAFKDRNRTLGQAARFAAIGVLGTSINFCVFSASLMTGLHYIAASFVGWATALVVVFTLNRAHTFASRAGMWSDFRRTIAVYSAQQIFMASALFVGVRVGLLNPQSAFLLALPFAIALSFFGMKYYVFAYRRPHVDAKANAAALYDDASGLKAATPAPPPNLIE